MNAKWMAIFAVVDFIAFLGCSGPSSNTASEDSPIASSAAVKSDARTAPRKARARPELPLLGEEERRVSLLVLPGDASVEVDGQPVRRRNGLIELVGKAGQVRRVRAFKGARSTPEKSITIAEAGAMPALVDLNDIAPVAVGAVVKKAKPIVFSFDE